jgi:tetratricopeptide (TPR) repeat protein
MAQPTQQQRLVSSRVHCRIPKEPTMRSIVPTFAATAALTIAILASAHAQTAIDTPVTCTALSRAPPAKLIESCTAVIDNAATLEADRLDATITRAVALQNSGESDKALAEIAGVLAKDPHQARAFRARGEIYRQTGKFDAAFEAFNEAIRLDPDNANAYESRGNTFNNTKKYDRAMRTTTRRSG